MELVEDKGGGVIVAVGCWSKFLVGLWLKVVGVGLGLGFRLRGGFGFGLGLGVADGLGWQ